MDAYPTLPMNIETDDPLTLETAAQYSGKSVKTLRRWIRTGRLLASTVSTPHGPAYRIWPADLAAAVATVDAIAVTRRESPNTELAAAVLQRLDDQRREIALLRAEVAELREDLVRRLPELPAGSPEWATAPGPSHSGTEEPVSAPTRRGWLARLLGR
jgi:hypothetical protein